MRAPGAAAAVVGVRDEAMWQDPAAKPRPASFVDCPGGRAGGAAQADSPLWRRTLPGWQGNLTASGEAFWDA